MTEKTPLRKLADIKIAEKEIKKEIGDEIESIFKEFECNGLDCIEYWNFEVWVHLQESCLIPTDLILKLNKYFHASGNLSYSGDGFIIVYKF